MSTKTKEPSQNGAPEWRTADLSKVLRNDLQAARAAIGMILDNPVLFDAMASYVEDMRAKMLQKEAELKKQADLDFNTPPD